MTNTWMSWSTGKDSAFTLFTLLNHSAHYNITGLFTSITDPFNRVTLHSTRIELLNQQIERMNFPLYKIEIPSPCTNEIYNRKMHSLIEEATKEKVNFMAFGDLFLEEVKDYRSKQLKDTSIQPLFPLWKINTHELARKMIALKFKAIITCVDETKMDSSFSGKEFDYDFLDSLPEGIDPCGENGEFHTFIYDCPLFSRPIPVARGEKVSRDGCTFTDITLN